MIDDICNYQRRALTENIVSHTEQLVRGTVSRDEDQRVRGIIRGLQMALNIVDDVEERANKAIGGSADDDAQE